MVLVENKEDGNSNGIGGENCQIEIFSKYHQRGDHDMVALDPSLLIQPFQYEFFTRAIVVSVLVGGVCGLIGGILSFVG